MFSKAVTKFGGSKLTCRENMYPNMTKVKHMIKTQEEVNRIIRHNILMSNKLKVPKAYLRTFLTRKFEYQPKVGLLDIY